MSTSHEKLLDRDENIVKTIMRNIMTILTIILTISIFDVIIAVIITCLIMVISAILNDSPLFLFVLSLVASASIGCSIVLCYVYFMCKREQKNRD